MLVYNASEKTNRLLGRMKSPLITTDWKAIYSIVIFAFKDRIFTFHPTHSDLSCVCEIVCLTIYWNRICFYPFNKSNLFKSDINHRILYDPNLPQIIETNYISTIFQAPVGFFYHRAYIKCFLFIPVSKVDRYAESISIFTSRSGLCIIGIP